MDLLPAKTARYIATLSDSLGLGLRELIYASYRTLGYSKARAYDMAYPDKELKRTDIAAARLSSKIKQSIGKDSLDLEDAQLVLAEYTTIRAMIEGNIELSLRGSDQYNKTRGRYDPKEPQRVGIVALLGALGKKETDFVEADLVSGGEGNERRDSG